MGRLSVLGKYNYQDGRKFFARGVSYGPFAPNSRSESYPEPDRTAADFALMSELGANLVRTYVMPPSGLFELAAKHGLRLMPGISWPHHLTFLDSPEMMRDIRDTFRREMAVLRQFKETVFAYNIGNEIRSDIVRSHGPRAVSRFLAELYDIGKQFDPAGLFTYSNYPSAEYLDLSFLDLVSFNVYLHRELDFRRYLTHLMAITRECPLILSETGIDTIREGEQPQAELLSWQSRAALEVGLSGLVIFAFTDEWFRGGGEIMDWAFGLTTRERTPKPSFSVLVALWELGPLLRSWERESVKWTFAPDLSGERAGTPRKLSGTILLMRVPEATRRAEGQQNRWDKIIETLRLALVRRGLEVAQGTSYDSFDLRIIVPPLARVSVLLMQSGEELSLGWHTSVDTWRTAVGLVLLLIVLWWGGFSLAGALSAIVVVAGGLAAIAIRRVYRVPPAIGAASTELVSHENPPIPPDQAPLAPAPAEGTAG
jgi:hypothetical protein